MEKKRSVGVMVFGLIDVILGLILFLPNLIYGLRFFLVPPINKATIMMSLPFIVIGVTYLGLVILGVWLLKLKPFGRKFSFLLCPLLIIVGLIYLPLTVFHLAKWNFEISVVFSSLILNLYFLSHICFLLFPKVKEQFK